MRFPPSLKNLISLNRQRRGLRAPSLIFPGDIVRKSFRRKQSKKVNCASSECGQRPQSAEIDTMPIEKGQPTLQPNAAQGAQRTISNARTFRDKPRPLNSVPPAEKITPRPDRMRPKGPQSAAPNTKNRSAQKGTWYRPLSVSGARGERHAKDAPIFDTICDKTRFY